MFKKNNCIATLLLVGLLISCTPTSSSGEAILTPDLNLTAENEAQASQQEEMTRAAQETADAEGTREAMSAQETQAAIEAANAEATSQAAAEQATMTAVFQATAARATEAAAEEATQAASTAEAILEATAQSQPMSDLVNLLFEQEIVSTTDGIYISLPEYQYEWAQLNWYNWLLTGLAPTDFVLQADLTWESASETANWWNSGCGFVFRINDDGDHYLTYLGLDGYVGFYRNINSTLSRVGSGYAGAVDLPAGSASLLVAVDGTSFSFFVDGERIHTRQDTVLSEGGLGYVLVSGTNKDFGTRCHWENVELWVLE